MALKFFNKGKLILYAWVALIGCSTDAPSKEGDCNEGESRWNKNNAQKCKDGFWEDWDDCGAQRKTCSMIQGEALCIDEEGIDGGNDSDVDSDTDTDADTDVDSDSDTDSDTDTDVDTDSDSDTDADSDNDADADCDQWYDSTSGLCWHEPWNMAYDWYGAEYYCNNLGAGWRLPKIQELMSLLRGCDQSACYVTDPDCLDPNCDQDCKMCMLLDGPDNDPKGCYWDPALSGTCEIYWSSSVYDFFGEAWCVRFDDGFVFLFDRSQDAYVRCVR